MKIASHHLTYCTNVHAGETWPEVFEAIREQVVSVKARVCPGREFGVGLRLSARAALALEQPAALDELEAFLSEAGLYVFTLNGFPFGPFHGRPVKQAVYRPDWRSEERAEYTLRLARVLARLLPERGFGSISTVPVGFRGDLREPGEVELAARRLIDQVVALNRLRQERGVEIALALEPEPRCLLETTPETVAFFERHLLSASALETLAKQVGCARNAAEGILRRHLGVCLDTCHAAIEFERADDTFTRLERAGLSVFKIQLSAGLRLEPTTEALEALRAYDEPVYLHQVVARQRDGGLLRFDDLPQAFDSSAARDAVEWRVHFHVPVYRSDLGAFTNTQGYLARVLARERARASTAHLEVETYTFGVLPKDQQEGGVVASIARELEWVEGRLSGPDAGP